MSGLVKAPHSLNPALENSNHLDAIVQLCGKDLGVVLAGEWKGLTDILAVVVKTKQTGQM